MKPRFTAEQVTNPIHAEAIARAKQELAQGRALDLPRPAGETEATVKPKKYRNQPCEAGGEKFDSKLEAEAYKKLCALWGKENVIRQVSIPIGDKRIRPDFLVIKEVLEGGKVFVGFFADAKGFATDAWTAKANHLKDKHGLSIELIRSKS
jgi:hypothetical protein